MAWIRVIEENEATGSLLRLYEGLRDPRHGRVDNILKIHGENPAVLKGHVRLYEAAMRGPSGLTPAEREMIAVSVSAANRCRY